MYADCNGYQFSFISVTNTSAIWAPWIFIHFFIDEQLCGFHSLGNTAWCSYEHLYRTFWVKECIHVFEYRNWYVALFEEISDSFHCSYTISLRKTDSVCILYEILSSMKLPECGNCSTKQSSGLTVRNTKAALCGKTASATALGAKKVKFTLISYVRHSILAKMISETLIKFSVHLCTVYTEKS